jgi:hypothetical protein
MLRERGLQDVLTPAGTSMAVGTTDWSEKFL